MPINRNALKKYAPKARRDFIAAVTARASKFGISDGEPVPMQEQGDVVMIGGEAFPKQVGVQRKALVRRINLHGFTQTMEEVAYTWFNRFLAIRFMELRGYMDHGHRVLSHPNGGDLPEILEHAEHLELAGLDKARVVELKLDGTKDTELYRLLLIAQCNALHDAMPFLFEKIDDETELLLPDNLLHTDSLIRQLVREIDESNWQEIEIIGWLYQFYISEKKDQVIGKVVKSEDIPAATQLFTPNWIVKYMVQNSLGHQWMATYPTSSLKDGMEYYIEPAEQTPEVQAQLAEITPKELNPEELTLLDPGVGSGHILVEAYDLFKQIYLERGYRLKDIPRLILEKNLYGLDIDDRAAQMAGFALLMKARADDRRILLNPVHLNVMAIQSSEGLDATEIAKHLLPSGRYELVANDDLMPDTLAQPTLTVSKTSEVKTGTIQSLINLFEDAKTFGSLITVPDNIRKALPALEQLLEQPSNGLPVEQRIREKISEELRLHVKQANMLGRQYDCVVANPPFMGSKAMNASIKKFLQENFADVKYDIFSAFIVRNSCLTKASGQSAFMTPFVWMYISSYEKLRGLIHRNQTIHSLIKPSYTAFFASAIVPICTFVIRNKFVDDYKSTYFDLGYLGNAEEQPLRFREAKKGTLEKSVFFQSSRDLSILPGRPIAYWISKKLVSLFEKEKPLADHFSVKSGIMTGNDPKFLRLWHEVVFTKIGQGLSSSDEMKTHWYPLSKGGDFRKWYGNIEHVINLRNDGADIKNGGGNYRLRDRQLYFRPYVTWSRISSSEIAFRYLSEGVLFSDAAPGIFAENDNETVIGLLNSKLGNHFLSTINPTLNYQTNDIERIPYIPTKCNENGVISKAVNISKDDWNFYETSMSFIQFPLLSQHLKKISTQASYEAWQSHCDTNIQTMKELEEANNRLFIEAYGLQDELTPDVPEDQITLARADREEDIKRLISYAIGCMMGRYSLAEEGLIYANSGNESFDPYRYGDFPADDDGIIPITDTEWFNDDATVRFEEFLKVAWSPETLKENLKFIGDSLANNGGNDPLKTIRNYLSKGFWKDHLQTYKKRPIYWLFSSGKQRAFECLVYLHRYNEGTLARMRMEYVTPLQSRMSARIEQLTGDVESGSSSAERNRKQKEKDKLVKQLEELRAFDEELRHYADQRITLDLDDGVKVNCGKFGNLLADVKAITGKK